MAREFRWDRGGWGLLDPRSFAPVGKTTDMGHVLCTGQYQYQYQCAILPSVPTYLAKCQACQAVLVAVTGAPIRHWPDQVCAVCRGPVLYVESVKPVSVGRRILPDPTLHVEDVAKWR